MPEYKPPPEDTTPASTGAQRTVGFNWEDWLPYIEELDGSDEEKRQLIETLWGIILAFVDLGWEVRGRAETDAIVSSEEDRDCGPGEAAPRNKYSEAFGGSQTGVSTNRVDKSDESFDLSTALRAAVVKSDDHKQKEEV